MGQSSTPRHGLRVRTLIESSEEKSRILLPVRVINPPHRRVVGTAGRQLTERARRSVDLILELASGKRLVLVEECSVPLSGEQKHVPALDLRGIRLGAIRLVAGDAIASHLKARQHPDRRLRRFPATAAGLLLNPDEVMLARTLKVPVNCGEHLPRDFVG
jgi:hypothetical protein